MQRVSKVGAQPGTASAAVAQGSQARGSAAVAFGTDDLGLSFYQNPPNVEVSVREFEELTRDRLKVLHVFDRACGYDTRLDAVGELKSKVSKELSETRLSLNYPKATAGDAFLEQKADFMRRDAISHYALRLAFCKTREARDWLVMQEQRLFVHRFEALRPEAQEACLSKFGLECRKVDPAARMGGDKGNLLELLQQTTPGGKIWRDAGAPPLPEPNFYEMHFTDVSPGLISSRRVVLQGGRAYVPSGSLKVILAKKFKVMGQFSTTTARSRRRWWPASTRPSRACLPPCPTRGWGASCKPCRTTGCSCWSAGPSPRRTRARSCRWATSRSCWLARFRPACAGLSRSARAGGT